MPTYSSRWPTYAKQWDALEVKRTATARAAATAILTNKARYQRVEELTKKADGAKDGVPWWWIGCAHYRESSLKFDTQLAQGDPLDRVSTHVPAGLGPYYGADAWERAALHILTLKSLHKVLDWRLEKALYYWEAYNGWGYFNHNIPSAYVWAGTNIARPGMYVADHDWSATTEDPRVGCAAILAILKDLDPTIKLVRETPPGVEPAPPEPDIPSNDSLFPAKELPVNPQSIIAVANLVATFFPQVRPFLPVIAAVAPAIVQLLSNPDALKAIQTLGDTLGKDKGN